MSKDIVNYIEEQQNEAGRRMAFEESWKIVVAKLYGKIKYETNQPGVEFFKELTKNINELGRKGDWIGWQCKWFNSKKGILENSHIQQIKNSLEKTHTHLPKINKWYLCTPQTISLASQEKIEELAKPFNIEVIFWDGDTLDEKAYEAGPLVKEFLSGKLTIDKSSLTNLVRSKINRADPNWKNIPHISFTIENRLKHILGQGYKDHFQKLINKIALAINNIDKTLDKEDCDFLHKLIKLFDPLSSFGPWSDTASLDNILRNTITNIKAHNLIAKYQNTEINHTVRSVVNDFATINSYIKEQKKELDIKSVGIIGDAGTGKTNLAISLVQGDAHRIPGILTFAKDLSPYDTVDSFFQKHVIFPGQKSIDSFSDLVMALNLVASKNQCRIPLIIEAINESKYTQRWNELIEEITSLLRDQDRIVLIYTTREDIESKAIDRKLSTESHYAPEASELTKAYFKYFNIKQIGPGNYYVPSDFPLALRLFCEDTNPAKKDTVTIQTPRWNISYLLHKKLNTIARKIASNNNNHESITLEDVFRFLIRIGHILFDKYDKPIKKRELLLNLKDINEDVNDKTLRLLESEGLIKISQNENDDYFVEISYQRLGGFLIAYFLVERNDITKYSNRQILDKIKSHPWHEDIWISLSCLFPEKYDEHLFNALPTAFKKYAIESSPKIKPNQLKRTNDIKEIQNYFLKIDPLQTLVKTRETWLEPKHPCNFKLVSLALSNLSFKNLNLYWCEYIRNNNELFYEILDGILQHKENLTPDVEEILVHFLAWMFASTHNEIPEICSDLLLFIGKKDPVKFLNEISIFFNNIDAQILEYLLFCAYSVVVNEPRTLQLEQAIATLLHKASKTFLNNNSKNFTTDILLLKAFRLLSNKYTSLTGKSLHIPIQKQENLNCHLGKNQELETVFFLEDLYCKSTILELLQIKLRSRPLDQLLGRVGDLGWTKKEFGEIDNRLRDTTIPPQHKEYSTYFHKFFSIAEKELIGALSIDDICPSTPRPYATPKNRIPLPNHCLLETDFEGIDWYNGIVQMDFQRIKSSLIKQLEDVVDPNDWELVHAKFHDQSFRQNKFLCIHFKSFLVTRKQQKCDYENGFWHYPSVGDKYLYEGPDISIDLHDEIRRPFIFDFEPIGEKQLVLLDSTLTKNNGWKFNFENYCYYHNDEQITKYIFTAQQNALYACEFLFIRRNWLADFLNKEGLFLLHSCYVENNKYPNVQGEWRYITHFSI